MSNAPAPAAALYAALSGERRAKLRAPWYVRLTRRITAKVA